jgi:hypothetical protein
MRSFTAFLRISFFLLIVCLGTDAQAQTAPPSHAHRYPDAVVVKVWTPTGERWLRLERTATGYYQGSIEFESVGWMAVTEYYEFTCLMTMGVRDSPFRFHHEFRDKDGYDAAPSEFWTELRYDWDLAVFTQPEDFGVYFDDPSPAVQPSSSQASLVGGVGQSQLTQAGQTKVASPVAAGQAAPSASGREEASVDAEGYDPFGLDRSGYGRDGYDADGYDRRGVDRQGFNRAGVYQGDFDAEGYDSTGYDRDGYDREGYDHNGRDREGYDYGGFNAAGYSRYGGYLYGYDQSYALPNADEPVFDARGFAATGLNQNGTYYDDLGYDVFGYDSLGFDHDGYDRGGFDATGWSRLGIDTEGYDRDGRNTRGFNRYGIHRNATLYDEQGFDAQGYNRQGMHYVAGDYASPSQPATQPESGAKAGGGGWTGTQKTMADLLDAESFPFRPADLSDREVGEILQKYGSVDNMTAEQWAELSQACLAAGLTKLWADLDDRIALVNLGFSDEDTDVLRAKQSQIEEYFLGADPSVTPTRLATAGKGDVAAKRAASALGANPAQATPPHDTMGTASIEFAKSFLTGLVLAAVVVAALPAILAAGTVVLAAAGMSAATISAVGVAAETGLVVYAAYDAGKTVVEVKDDLAAGRLDAAASKIGSMTGTVVGGVGASKIIGGAASGAASKVAGEATEGKALVAAKETELGTVVVRTSAMAPASEFVRLEPRTLQSAKKIEDLVAKMKVGGWQGEPISVFEHNGTKYILDGHHRVAAARELGLEVPYQTIPASRISEFNYSSVDEILAHALEAVGR